MSRKFKPAWSPVWSCRGPCLNSFLLCLTNTYKCVLPKDKHHWLKLSLFSLPYLFAKYFAFKATRTDQKGTAGGLNKGLHIVKQAAFEACNQSRLLYGRLQKTVQPLWVARATSTMYNHCKANWMAIYSLPNHVTDHFNHDLTAKEMQFQSEADLKLQCESWLHATSGLVGPTVLYTSRLSPPAQEVPWATRIGLRPGTSGAERWSRNLACSSTWWCALIIIIFFIIIYFYLYFYCYILYVIVIIHIICPRRLRLHLRLSVFSSGFFVRSSSYPATFCVLKICQSSCLLRTDSSHQA